MSDQPLTVADLERLLVHTEAHPPFWKDWRHRELVRVCRHALALEAEVARLRRQIEGHAGQIAAQAEVIARRAERHEVHDDDGESE